MKKRRARSERETVLFSLYGRDKDAEGSALQPTWTLSAHWPTAPRRLVLLIQSRQQTDASKLARRIEHELGVPVDQVPIKLGDPWRHRDVYRGLLEFWDGYDCPADADKVFSLGTGTEVFTSCLTILAVTGRMPVKLAQPVPEGAGQTKRVRIVDPAELQREFRLRALSSAGDQALLTDGVDIRDPGYLKVIDEIRRRAAAVDEPILLLGETGTGKTRLAKNIYKLKKKKGMKGEFVAVNCAALDGELLQSELFGHAKGAFTGAVSKRAGKLKKADGGMLYLDEVAELPPKTQTMLLKAIEEGRFSPLGSEDEEQSRFFLVCTTNQDLFVSVRDGLFRSDLFERISVWVYDVPCFRERIADIEGVFREVRKELVEETGLEIEFEPAAEAAFLAFAESARARWLGNFRDLRNALKRMDARAERGRIGEAEVAQEIADLTDRWRRLRPAAGLDADRAMLARVLDDEAIERIDRFDQIALAGVIRVCAEARDSAEAGRLLFDKSRVRKRTSNDSDRILKYLKKYGLTFRGVRARLKGGGRQ